MRVFPFCHWNAPDGPSVPTVNITSVTLPYFGGTDSGVGAAACSLSPQLFCIAPQSGIAWVMTSPDGITWTQRSLPGSSTSWNNMTANASNFAIASSSIMQYYRATASNPSTWTTASLPVLNGTNQPVANKSMSYISYLKYISPTGRGWVWTGSTWAVMLISALPLGYMTQKGARAITPVRYLNNNNYITNWPGGTISTSANKLLGMQGLATAGLQAICFAFQNIASASAKSSPDGNTWTSRVLPENQLHSVAGATSTHVYGFAPNSATFIYSSDGVTWYTGSLPTAENWNACAGSDTELMVFSGSSNQAYKITIS